MSARPPAEGCILVVDDNEATCLLISRILQQELGLETVTARDGADAERKVMARRFDTILLDLLMPGVSGFDVLKMIRSGTHANVNTPVIVVSVLDDEASLKRCEELGATYYVVKPVMRESLTRVVADHLSGHRRGTGDRPAAAPPPASPKDRG